MHTVISLTVVREMGSGSAETQSKDTKHDHPAPQVLAGEEVTGGAVQGGWGYVSRSLSKSQTGVKDGTGPDLKELCNQGLPRKIR